MKFLTLKTLSSLTFISLLSACSSTPTGPVTDKFTTEPFVWDSEKSEALNLLKSADLNKYFNDVDSEDDFNNVRYRKSTAKSVFDYVGGFAAFGIAGLLNNHANHEDDENSKFKGPTYVSYIPVDKKNLTNIEQSIVRDKAVKEISAALNNGTKDNWNQKDKNLYVVNFSGESCKWIGDAYKGTTLEKSPCKTAAYPNIVRVSNGNQTKLLAEQDAKFVAVVKVYIPSPFAAIALAKNLNDNSFMAFPDVSKTYGTYVKTSSPVIATYNRILPFLNPEKSKITDVSDKNIETVICLIKTSNCYITPISVDEKPLIKTKMK
jgi:hypothetical protein